MCCCMTYNGDKEEKENRTVKVIMLAALACFTLNFLVSECVSPQWFKACTVEGHMLKIEGWQGTLRCLSKCRSTEPEKWGDDKLWQKFYLFIYFPSVCLIERRLQSPDDCVHTKVSEQYCTVQLVQCYNNWLPRIWLCARRNPTVASSGLGWNRNHTACPLRF